MPVTEQEIKEAKDNLATATLEATKAKAGYEAKAAEMTATAKKLGEDRAEDRKELEKLAESYKKLAAETDDMMKSLSRPGAPMDPNQPDKEKEKSRAAFLKFMRADGDASVLTAEEKEYCLPVKEAREKKALIASNSELGGFMVSPVLSSRMIEKVVEVSPMRQLGSVFSFGAGDSLELIKETGTHSNNWATETGTKTETTGMKFGKVKIPTHENYALLRLSYQLLQDTSFDLEAWIATRAAKQFAKSEGLAFISGNGVSRPKGILNYTEITSLQSTAANSGEFTPDDLVDFEAALPSTYAVNARHMVHRKTMAFIRKFRDNQNRYLDLVERQALSAFKNSNGGANPQGSVSIDGYLAFEAVDMPQLASAAQVAIFGDFQEAYGIVDRPFMIALRDPYSLKLQGLVEWMFTRKVGGGLLQEDAVRILKCAV